MMKSQSHVAGPKKDMKIRPVMIRHLYKNNTHPYNNPTIKFNSQVHKKSSKQNERVKTLAKSHDGVEIVNKEESVQVFGTQYTNMHNKACVKVQVSNNKNNEDEKTIFRPMKTNIGRDTDLFLPLIVKKVSLQVPNRNKQKERQQKDFPGLPRTALFIPFLKNTPTFLPSSNYKELTYPDINLDILQELSRAEIYKGPRKIVYEIYEVSPYTKNDEDYGSFLAYNSEASLTDSSWDSYFLVCMDRGGPIRYFAGKARYQEELIPYYIPESLEDKILVFESRFESGNLRRAVQM